MLSYDQSVRAFGYFIVCQENTAFGYALFLWDIFIELSKSVTVLKECTTNFHFWAAIGFIGNYTLPKKLVLYKW